MNDSEPTAGQGLEVEASALPEPPPPGGGGKVLSPAENILKGTVNRITFRNADNLYSVLEVAIEGGKERIKVVGPCIHIHEQDQVVAHGKYIQHPRFGKQFAATIIERIEPSSADGIARYLGSGLIKGIGPGTARRIVAAFGDEALEVIHREPKRLARIAGVGKHKAEIIREAFHEESTIRRIMQFLVSHRITPNLAHKIYVRYKESSVDVISADPYVLARDIKGVGFRTADVIATEGLGLALDSPQRLRAGLAYALERAAEDGHCYLPRAELLVRAAALLLVPEDEALRLALDHLVEETTLIERPHGIYTAAALSAEEFLAAFVRDRAEAVRDPMLAPAALERHLHEAETSLGISFSREQRAAVEAAVENRLLVITGGPGCGKTTLIRALSHTFRALGKNLYLTAPTGRAAQRMSQVCEFHASTIHRLLKFVRGSFEYCANNPLPADVVVVDEASMVDIYLGKSLLAAIPSSCVLILVGDKDQLPSVGPGRVFADLIAANRVKTVFLSQLFRRHQQSTINEIAHCINVGTIPIIPEPDGHTKVDAYFLSQKDPEEAGLLVEKLIAEQLPKKFGFNHQDIMVLTPSNRGPLGVEALNLRLQARLNPSGSRDASQEITIGQVDFRLGDRVVQRVNNYQLHEAGVFNGDGGSIYSVNREKKSLKVDLWDGRIIEYSETDASQLNLAYAMTVHRSQGAEIPCVVLILHDSHYTMLERQLVYTAVTRAKKLLIVVGTRKAIAVASRRTTASNRHTWLRELVDQ